MRLCETWILTPQNTNELERKQDCVTKGERSGPRGDERKKRESERRQDTLQQIL